MEKIRFTIINPDSSEETPLFVEYNGIDEPVILQLGGPAVVIDSQQLAELGALFLALAGTNVDYESADALLEGFELKGKEAAIRLSQALEE